MSRFGAIESSAATQLATLVPASFAVARAVPARSVFELPEAYPAAFLSLDTARLEKTEPVAFGHVTQLYEITLWIVIYAASDGQSIGDARTTAWTLADAVLDCLIGFSPTGLPANTKVIWPLTPGDVMPIDVDTGKFGIAIPFKAKIQWTT